MTDDQILTTEQRSAALKKLRYLVDRSDRHGGVPFSEEFVRSERLGLLVGSSGGRGGDVRLKLYMSITLLAVGRNNDVRNTPGSSWAEALGLPDPRGAGTRRITAALNWLHENKYVKLRKAPGMPHDVRLLDPMGTGKKYSRPNRGRSRWVKVPLELWSNGWIVSLSGRAVAALVVILDRLGTKRSVCWIDPLERSEDIDLSDATWTRALRELSTEGHGIILVGREPLGTSENFDFSRLRNTYRVQAGALDREPIEWDSHRLEARRAPGEPAAG